MINTTTIVAASLVAVYAITTGGVAHAQNNPVDRVSNPDAHSYTDVGIAPRDMNPPFVRDGFVIEPQRFVTITQGLEESQVQSLLGTPQRRNGREWDYNVRIKMAQSDNFLICQYKVVFDEQQQVRETVWRRRQCQDLARNEVAPR